MGVFVTDRWKKLPKWKKYSVLGLCFLAFILIIFLLSQISDSPMTKDRAYYKCLSKAKECSGNVPGLQMEFMLECKRIYLWSDENPDSLMGYTNEMC